jgi:hypothetical protein
MAIHPYPIIGNYDNTQYHRYSIIGTEKAKPMISFFAGFSNLILPPDIGRPVLYCVTIGWPGPHTLHYWSLGLDERLNENAGACFPSSLLCMLHGCLLLFLRSNCLALICFLLALALLVDDAMKKAYDGDYSTVQQ